MQIHTCDHKMEFVNFTLGRREASLAPQLDPSVQLWLQPDLCELSQLSFRRTIKEAFCMLLHRFSCHQVPVTYSCEPHNPPANTRFGWVGTGEARKGKHSLVKEQPFRQCKKKKTDLQAITTEKVYKISKTNPSREC